MASEPVATGQIIFTARNVQIDTQYGRISILDYIK